MDADGHIVEEADWETKNGRYRVRVPKAPDSKDMIWIEVPDAAVIKEPNKAARTMVWPFYDNVQGFSNDESYPLVFSLLYAREYELNRPMRCAKYDYGWGEHAQRQLSPALSCPR